MRIIRIVLLVSSLFLLGDGLHATTIDVNVTLKFTGITHLIGKKVTERLIVIPNHSEDEHELIIASPIIFGPDLPNEKGDGTTVYKWGPAPLGFKFDLKKSTGWVDALNKELKFTELGDPADTCPEAYDAPAESLHWLPRLSTVSKHFQAKVKAEFEVENPDKSKVWARLQLKKDEFGGRLEAELPAQRFKFIFREGWYKDDDIRQTIAAYLNYTFVVQLDEADPKFKLMALDYDGNPITLGTFKAVNRKIDIIFANMMPEEFFKQQDRSSHFDLYFLAIDGAPAVHVHNLYKKCGGGVGSEIECGPVRLP
jgi:hypothetical protein